MKVVLWGEKMFFVNSL